MNKKLPPLSTSVVLSCLLLGVLLIPGAQTALDTIIAPLRRLTYPQASSDSLPLADEQSSSDQLQVISYGVNSAKREIIVDSGSVEVETGDAVLANGVLVGVVSHAQARSVVVTLINDPSFRVIARTSAGAQGLVSASYNQLLLGDVAQDQSLAVGDRVTTLNNQYSNVGEVPVGAVDELVETSGLLKQALITQPVELDNLSTVSIP